MTITVSTYKAITQDIAAHMSTKITKNFVPDIEFVYLLKKLMKYSYNIIIRALTKVSALCQMYTLRVLDSGDTDRAQTNQ